MRPALFSDIPVLVEMGRQFHEQVKPEWPWCSDSFSVMMASLIEDGFVRITGNGFMAGVLTPSPLNHNWLVAHELLWWSTDDSGSRLLRAFRKWAKENAADEIKWSCRYDNERVRRFYGKFATPCETTYSEIL